MLEQVSNKKGIFHSAGVVKVKIEIPLIMLQPETKSAKKRTHLGRLTDVQPKVERIKFEFETRPSGQVSATASGQIVGGIN